MTKALLLMPNQSLASDPFFPGRLSCRPHFSGRYRRERKQFCHSDQVVGRCAYMSHQLIKRCPSQPCFPQPTNCLEPTKDFFHSLSFLLAHLITCPLRGPAINTGNSFPIRYGDVRLYLVLPQKLHKFPSVIPFVSAYRLDLSLASLPLALYLLPRTVPLSRSACLRDSDVHAESVAVLHQDVAGKTQPCSSNSSLTRQSCFRIGRALVRLVASLIAMKVHRRVSGIIVSSLYTFIRLPLETLQRCPCFNQRAVYRKMLIGKKGMLTGILHDVKKELLRYFMLKQSVTILREHTMIKGGSVNVHVQKPPKQNVVIQGLAKQPVRPYRIQRNQNHRFQQRFRRDRRSSRPAVHLTKGIRKTDQNLVCHSFNGSKRVILGNPLLGRDETEHETLGGIVTAHRCCPFR